TVDRTGGEHDHIVALAQLAGVELLRVHDVEGEAELFENPARPARGHRATVTVPEGDSGGGEALQVRRGGRGGLRGDAEIGGGLGERVFRGRRDEEIAAGARGKDGHAGLQEAVDENEGVVAPPTDEPAGGGIGDLGGGRRLQLAVRNAGERAVETFEHAVEL